MINVAVVGCGYWGLNYVRMFSKLQVSQVISVCDLRKEQLLVVKDRYPSIRTYKKLSEMLEKERIDTVVISTHATTHYEVAKQVILRDKHLLVEKPFTTRLEEAEELVDLAQERNLTLMIGHIFLFNSGIQKIKKSIGQPEFGQIYYLQAVRTNLGPIRQDVGAAWDLAAHDISIFSYLLNKQPDWVSAVGTRPLSKTREDVAFITLNFPGNIMGNIRVSWLDPNKVRELVVVGDNQRIVFNDLDSIEQVKIFEKGIAVSDSDSSGFSEFNLIIRDGDIFSPKIEPSEPLMNQCVHFLDCIKNGTKPITDGQSGVNAVRVLEAVQRSMSYNGTPEKVNA